MKVSPVRHPLESLGLVRIERGEIRVEKLSQRAEPAVPFPHRHDFYQLLWIERGTGWHDIDFNRHTVAGYQIYVMKPGQVHGWSLSSNAEGVIVEFSTESLRSVGAEISIESILLQLPDLVSLKGPASKSIQNQIEEMLIEFATRRPAFEKILEAYLSILIFHLARSAKGTSWQVTGGEALVSKFQNLIEQNFKSEHGLEFYAEKLKLSPRALTMRTTRHLEKAGRDVIFDRLVLEAKRMLVYSEQSISNIGYLLGFEDANHFSRFFKMQTGKTAQTFRSSHRKNS